MGKWQLCRRDWIVAALQTLAREGVHGVKVERLARSLGVTKGSFYWHFRDRDDLLQAVLDYWQQDLTVQIRNEAQAFRGRAEQRLFFLARIINEKRANEFEGALRAWALSDRNVAKVVREVDQTRLAFLKQVFEEIGFCKVDSKMRARVFMHYEVAEPSIFLGQTRAEHDELMRLRIEMLTSRPGDGPEEGR
jgi:AcrR family transcriptional regulator